MILCAVLTDCVTGITFKTHHTVALMEWPYGPAWQIACVQTVQYDGEKRLWETLTVGGGA